MAGDLVKESEMSILKRHASTCWEQYGIDVRGPLDPGNSGASVYLIDYNFAGARRLGVLKLVPYGNAEAEERGYRTATGTWMQAYLPDFFSNLGPIEVLNRVAFLYSLCKDRIENSRTLGTVLEESFPYASGTLLFAITYAYRQQATQEWEKSRSTPARECFQECFLTGVANGWLSRWTQSGLPGADSDAIIFEGNLQRWPNPVAFVLRNDVWPDDATLTTKVPHIDSHGDLNPQNILCPSVDRAIALGILGTQLEPANILSHIGIIDAPFCRKLAYTYDTAFLCSCLRSLLPDMDSRASRDIVLRAFASALDAISLEREPSDVHIEASHFVRCALQIWKQAQYAQPGMVEDIKKAFLASLSASSLWQAVKSLKRSKKEAIRALCLSALALDRLLGMAPVAPALKGGNFDLHLDQEVRPEAEWTAAAAQVGRLIQSLGRHRLLVLVLGSEWGTYLESPPDSQVAKIRTLRPQELLDSLSAPVSEKALGRVNAVGRLPLAAVLDWSVFPHLRERIAEGIRGPHFLKTVLETQLTELDLTDHDAVYFFSVRGTLDNLPSLALTGPERNARRGTLRGYVEAFRKGRPAEFTVLYVGCALPELQELHGFLHSVWPQPGALRPVFLGREADDLNAYCSEWTIQPIPGGIPDFLTACEDVPESTVVKPSSSQDRRTLRVAGLDRRDDGELVKKDGETVLIELPPEDAEPIARAGFLLCENDLRRLDEPDRHPREFFIGRRITFSEVHRRVLVERKSEFQKYMEAVRKRLAESYPQTLRIPSRPGGGATTALRYIAYQLAYLLHVPTLVLDRGGNLAFEAIERIQRLTGGVTFVVVADPEDVPSDQLRALQMRCAPGRYPVLFLTSVRVTKVSERPPAAIQGKGDDEDELPTLDIRLRQSGGERTEFLQRLAQYCPETHLTSLLNSREDSMFLLTLEALGGQSIRLNTFVTDVMERIASEEQQQLIATVALFSHFAHRPCSDAFLQVLADSTVDRIQELLEPFDQLLLLREGEGNEQYSWSEDAWGCRHVLLSKRILQYHLARDLDSDEYRHRLSNFCVSLIERMSHNEPGADIAAEYVWALLNPQLEVQRTGSPTVAQSKLVGTEGAADGIPTNVGRRRVYQAAADAFPNHGNITSHYGKFLSEVENNWNEADKYLNLAYEIDPTNETISHMLGMRHFDEIRQLIKQNDPAMRPAGVSDRLRKLYDLANEWFDNARKLNKQSEYNYTTPIQLDIQMMQDQFKRLGIRSSSERPEVLVEGRVSSLLVHAHAIVAEGLRYVDESTESRHMFRLVRDSLHKIRGDIDTAIALFQGHVQRESGETRAVAKVQLARYLLERGESRWLRGDQGKANKDFNEGQSQLFEVLEDPRRRADNIKLWFDCARHAPHWNRADFLERLHELHDREPSSLDAAFLLMCLYFAEAVQTGSFAAWRECEAFQRRSAELSSNLAVRLSIREWLVDVPVNKGSEYRVYPHHLFDDPSKLRNDPRVTLQGRVSAVKGSTVAYVRIEPMGIELFFPPRVRGREFYRSDEGAQVKFKVTFTYEKPRAFDVTRA